MLELILQFTLIALIFCGVIAAGLIVFTFGAGIVMGIIGLIIGVIQVIISKIANGLKTLVNKIFNRIGK